jgi:hypothetical protein
MPRRGTVTVTGAVTNRSEDTWTDLQAYLFTSQTPIGNRADLAEAAASPAETEVGARLAEGGLFDEIGDLEPGESASYTLSVRRRDLEVSGDPGVYWAGVHVLGAVDGVRDSVADGRARTFLPLVGRRKAMTDLALVLPLRGRVRRAPDGHLLALGRWQQAVGPDGRLGRLTDLARESQGPLTWLVDPAVLDAVASVAGDNPMISTRDDGTGPKDATASPSASSSDPAPENPDAPDADDVLEPTLEAQAARVWLEDFAEQAAATDLMSLPYGDVDVAAVSMNRLDRILKTARRLSRGTLTALGLDSTPVVAPASGLLPPRSLGAVNGRYPVLLSDRAYPAQDSPLLVRPDGTEVLLGDTAVVAGGPGPNDRTDPLALRQRILADAALHQASADVGPLIVMLPPDYDPGPSWQDADFFDGLDVPWLRQVDLARTLSVDGGTPVDEAPVYTDRERRRQIPFANQLATQELVDTGQVYADLLTRNDSIGADLSKIAMLASSTSARSQPQAALERTRTTTLRVRRSMQLVDIDGPPFVMMSSETGPITVSVVNNLDETVTVQLRADTPGDELLVTSPEPITLGPGDRAPVRMRAESTSIGVHQVTLVATTQEGGRLGSEVQFNVRTSNVGFVIWVVMAAAGALLLVMIVFRVTRRLRHQRAEEGAP